MADVDPAKRQEIEHATLEKAFEKLVKKGVIKADKLETLKKANAEARRERPGSVAADVDPIKRQEIVHDTLEKVFKKLVRKGAVSADKHETLKKANAEARRELLSRP
jgi:uncharacterized protein YutE (UPF0331/DUF86 family)